MSATAIVFANESPVIVKMLATKARGKNKTLATTRIEATQFHEFAISPGVTISVEDAPLVEAL